MENQASPGGRRVVPGVWVVSCRGSESCLESGVVPGHVESSDVVLLVILLVLSWSLHHTPPRSSAPQSADPGAPCPRAAGSACWRAELVLVAARRCALPHPTAYWSTPASNPATPARPLPPPTRCLLLTLFFPGSEHCWRKTCHTTWHTFYN